MERLRAPLTAGIAALNLELSNAQINQLLNYASLLAKWNKTYNLTARAVPQEILQLHLLDSLAVLPYLEGDCIADIGTGAGIPGIMLAIAAPDRQFHLIDSSSKKIRFVRQALLELNLGNAHASAARVESLQYPNGFSTVVSRAFTSAAEFVDCTRHLVRPGGLWLALKGRRDDAEFGQLDLPWQAHALHVPGLVAERHVLCIRAPGS